MREQDKDSAGLKRFKGTRMASSDIKAASTDAIRLQNHRNQMERQHEMEMRDLKAKQNDEVARVLDNHAYQIENLKQGYEVQISAEGEALEEKLQKTRMRTEERLNEEKRMGEMELAKVRTANQQRIEEYKKNGEIQVEAVKKQLQATTETLHEKAKKSARQYPKEIS